MSCLCQVLNPFVSFCFKCMFFILSFYVNDFSRFIQIKICQSISSPPHLPVIHILLLTDAEVLIIMVANEVQAENALFGEHGAVLGANMYLDSPYYDTSF